MIFGLVFPSRLCTVFLCTSIIVIKVGERQA